MLSKGELKVNSVSMYQMGNEFYKIVELIAFTVVWQGLYEVRSNE